jgi:Arc/MetJ-type ribon-helix-helix transcriptional regulator
MARVECFLTGKEMEAIQELIDAGAFPDVSAFLLAAVREKLEACSAGACRTVDERAERHEIKEYFKTKGETYPSDACLDLGLGYDQICRVIEDLNSEVMLGDL